jgi:hypothetical protein
MVHRGWGGPKWPDNGLTLDENRMLFASKNSDEVANLVLSGRRFAKERGPQSLEDSGRGEGTVLLYLLGGRQIGRQP